MENSFWLERWEQNQIGFHEDQVNPGLVAFWDQFSDVTPVTTVFVPLCGKSLDMLWLQQRGYQVIGNELSQLAVEAFFSENNLTYQHSQIPDFDVYECSGIRIFCGDFFAMSQQHLEGVTAVYDRASLVALPETMRADYVTHLLKLFPDKLQCLLLTLEYLQGEMQGPPFSVTEEEVISLYSRHFNVACLQRSDVLAKHPQFRNKGVTKLEEKVFGICR